MSVQTGASERRDPQRDFDFFMGEWKVANRRLRNPLAGSTTWYEFESTAVARPVWGGAANMDEFVGETPDGPLNGMTLRLFDPRSEQWRLYWANRKSGHLDAPVVGSFNDAGRGEFVGLETHDGKQVLMRFVWSEITATSCRWEQFYSPDGGATWESNWVMEFTRTK